MTKTYDITYNPETVRSKPKQYSTAMNRHVAGINVTARIEINQFAEMVSAPYSHTWYGDTVINHIRFRNPANTINFG